MKKPEVQRLSACFKGLKAFVVGLGLTHAQGYGGKKSVGAINRDTTACRLEVR